ncbi:hypothetical protein L7E55_02120 [Pelotomaculum isophthalicicum JI]|uniref:Exo-alpha-sialidase n=1 Tax=Pelotomaculum isophthalicicum JI TaxID=947010 RepID=A0A9X4H0B0_9FIRM|nr:hypothetical protein [Pelotomaculum isophthalicicum]MDF9407161.1 hypothetical protein [Pelotomaculum isophthalicicum JI]
MDVSTGCIISSQSNFLLSHQMLRDATGKLWLFYLAPDAFLNCGTSENEGKTWSNPSELTDEVSGPFTAVTDQNNHIHLCAVRRLNELTYMQWDGLNWSRNILPMDNLRGQPFFPIAHIDRWGVVHIVCGFRSNPDEWSVVHYLIDARKNLLIKTHYDVPCALDILLDISTKDAGPKKYVSFLAGALDSDTQGNLHLVHRYFDGRYFQLYYNFFNSGSSQWGPPVPLIDADCNCGIPSMFIDPQDNIHLLWSSFSAGKFRLNYRRKSGDWQQQVILSEKSTAIESPLLLHVREEVAACWHENGKILYHTLNNFSDEISPTPWICPDDTAAIKVNSNTWSSGSKTTIPLTLARKENGHHIIHFDTANLTDDIPNSHAKQDSDNIVDGFFYLKDSNLPGIQQKQHAQPADNPQNDGKIITWKNL